MKQVLKVAPVAALVPHWPFSGECQGKTSGSDQSIMRFLILHYLKF